MNKVFLGGTCNNTTWRDDLMPLLDVSYFNPVVQDWTPDCQDNENYQKNVECNVHFYLLNDKMKGVYSVAEVLDSANQSGKVTILHVIPDNFDDDQLKSLKAVVKLVINRGGIAYIDSDLYRSARVLNTCFAYVNA